MADRRALFLGSKRIGLKALQSLTAIRGCVVGAVTIDDLPDDRSVLPEFRSYCEGVGLSLSVINTPSELSGLIQRYSPQFVLVVGWYWIIDADLLNSAPGGFVGVHASLLPKYRGHAPLVWAMLRGEEQTGVSLFYFDQGIDTGDIVDQISFPIGNHEMIADILLKAETATVELITNYARDLLSGTAPRRKQNHALATYGSLRRPEDGRINWNQSAKDLYNFVRAQTRPYPGAFTHLPDGKRVQIWRASLFPYPYYGIPGLVGQKHGDGVVVACGEGALVIQECEVEGNTLDLHSALKWGARLG